MLEKSRVIHQSLGEANFHIFYNVMCGFSPEERKRYFLEAPEKYRYVDCDILIATISYTIHTSPTKVHCVNRLSNEQHHVSMTRNDAVFSLKRLFRIVLTVCFSRNVRLYELLHQKTNNLHMQNQIGAFVFFTRIVQSLFFLNLKFQASSLLL